MSEEIDWNGSLSVDFYGTPRNSRTTTIQNTITTTDKF